MGYTTNISIEIVKRIAATISIPSSSIVAALFAGDDPALLNGESHGVCTVPGAELPIDALEVPPLPDADVSA
jgi:hypothetical protein